MKAFKFLLPLILLSSCAQIVIPEGGAKDSAPPVLISSNPIKNASNTFPSKIELRFNENISLKSPTKCVNINPRIEQNIDVRVQKNTLKLQLPTDSLKPNTTYSLNFGQNISDLNEGNIYPNFYFSFSTGPFIDSSAINGMAKSIKENTPIENAKVELINTKNLNTYTTLTDKTGYWELNSLANGQYRLFIYGDINSNDKLDPQELYYLKSLFVSDTLITHHTKLIAYENLDSMLKPLIIKTFPINEYSFSVLLNTSRLTVEQMSKYLNNEPTSFPLYPYSTTRSDSFVVYHSLILSDSFFVTFKTIDTVQNIPLINQNKKTKTELSISLLNPIVSKNNPVYIKTTTPVLSVKNTEAREGFNLKKIDAQTLLLENFNYSGSSMFIDSGTITDINGQKNKGDTLVYTLATAEQTGNYEFTVKDSILPYSGPLKVLVYNTNSQFIYTAFLNRPVKLNSLLPGKYTIEIWQDVNNNEIWDQGNYYHQLNPEKIIVKKDFILIKENFETTDVDIYMD